ncbi:MAG: electron transport complex subunit RsxC [Spirochaetaceae bacterium]|jgi:electron transport complex protein RnfC|nr:electron transport complex subunit RsxC [Spirochaetaceae bacterium]
MVVSSFKRGIHIPERKDATTGKPAELVPVPQQVVIPVNQHFGAPNKVLVAVGDAVKRGQKIADAAAPGPMTVPVHASIAGVVKKIETRVQSNNTTGQCVVIEADDSVSGDDFLSPLDPFTCSKDEALTRIREAGIVGMGGAGFPAHVKLNPPPHLKIDYIIADGAECEGYLTTDEAAISAKAETIVKGVAILQHITGVKAALIAMEDNKAFLVPKLEKAIADGKYPGEMSVRLCRTQYPQGGEKLLIKALTGREVPSGGLPGDSGCIVQNVGSLLAIAEAFALGRPLIKRGLTVSGGACGNPRNIVAPIGTVLSALPPEYLAINWERLQKIIFGGPMMGTAVPSADIPIQKNTSGVLFLTAEESYADEESHCIRCGRCVRNCSAHLYPVLMNNALAADDFEGVQKAGLMDCFECGACTFNCPARIRLTQRFRVGKFKLRNFLAAKQAAAQKKAQARAAQPAQV